MFARNCVIGVLLASMGIASVAAAESAPVLLEQAVFAEEMEGDLDAAIKTYRKVLKDGEATRPVLAQAHYRLATCLLKAGRSADAVKELRTLAERYPDQAEVVAEARALLDALTTPDPAGLMPPETLLYAELGSSGLHAAAAFNMVRSAAMAASGAGGPFQQEMGRGADFLAPLLNPALIDELGKVRRLAVGVYDLDLTGTNSLVAVLYPGESTMVRELTVSTLATAGSPGEPIEGMQTLVLNGSAGGAVAYDDNAVIFALPADRLAWCVRQYRGVSQEPSLVSANPGFARLPRADRQRDALAVWIDSSRLLPLLASTGQGPEAARFEMIRAMLDLDHVGEVVARMAVDERAPFVEAAAYLQPEYKSQIYDLVRTPSLDTADFGAVPADAFLVIGAAPQPAQGAQAMAVAGLLANLGDAVAAQQLYGTVEQIALFVVPPDGPVNLGPGFPGNVFSDCIGLAIASRDPAATKDALDRFLGAAEAEGPVLPAGVRRCRIGAGDQTIPCYTSQQGNFTALALSPRVVLATLAAAKGEGSALAAGPLREHLDRLPRDTSKLVLLNVGGAMRAWAPVLAQASGFQEMAAVLTELADAYEGAAVHLRTAETERQMSFRIGVDGLPDPTTVVPLFMRLYATGMAAARTTGRRPGSAIGPVPDPEPVRVRYGGAPIVVDGNLDEWGGIAPLPLPQLGPNVAGPFLLCWREEGIYGALRATDEDIRPNHEEPWTADGLQLFVETDCARSPEPTSNSMTLTFWPDPEAGPGGARISVYWPATERSADGTGKDDETGILCAWSQTPEGYVLEYFMPAAALTPARMESGTRLGLNLLLRDGSITPTLQLRELGIEDGHLRPNTWGVVELARGQRLAPAPRPQPRRAPAPRRPSALPQNEPGQEPGTDAALLGPSSRGVTELAQIGRTGE